jgi:cysteinyl-tRNA synthetase
MLILSLFLLSSCDSGTSKSDKSKNDSKDYRQEMRNFVIALSDYAKSKNPDFMIIAQNGHELLTDNGEADGLADSLYIKALDGIGREDLNYGYNQDDEATPESIQSDYTQFLTLAESQGVEVLVTDYCFTQENVQSSYALNESNDFISFAADSRDLNSIPRVPLSPHNINVADIETLADAKNYLYFLDPSIFLNRQEYLDIIKATNFDLLILDFQFEDATGNATELTEPEVRGFQYKPNGGSRLAIAYMSIGEAEEYRFYWKIGWRENPPTWLAGENPDWEGNFKVKYWDPEWQAIIFGNPESYLDRIIEAGFNGVYLDIIDAFEYFENN